MSSEYFYDYELYSRHNLKIATKQKALVPFHFNSYQRKLHQLVCRLRDENKPIRVIVLKARQTGISTWSAGYVYHQAATNFFTKAVIIAHDIESTSNIFTITKRMYDFSPPIIKPMSRYSNRRELVFENDDSKTRDTEPGLLSSIEIETANKKTAGRGSTVHALHISELAFWPDASTSLSALLQSVPNIQGTSVIIESTANGLVGDGEEFYKRWKNAENGESDFIPFFIPWFENAEYTMTPEPGFNATHDEVELASRFSLTNGQLQWRRWKIKNDFNNDVKIFQQEFPCTPEEAFVVSGRPVFNIELLKRRMSEIDRETQENDDRFWIYERPQDGQVYAIGADVAEGLEMGDHSTAFVIDRNYRQVAGMKVKQDPDHFARSLTKLGRMYNNAILAPEINSLGYAVLSRLKDEYNHIYAREEFDELADKRMKKLGWHTNVKTKDTMLSEFRSLVRDNEINIRDPELYKEMMTLSYEDDGNVNLNGKDLTVAACIAVQALKQAPLATSYKATFPEHVKIIKPESFQERARRIAKNKGSYYY